MKLGKVERWSLRYFLLKSWVGFWHNNIFYRKIIILNKENIPRDKHLIFTINHQNSLMDALALLYALRWKQPVFLARSDIFKKNFIARLLFFVKILPIYRIRDGFDSLKNNDAVFLKTIEVIKNGRGLALLPEGSHEGIHRLRQLKKGFARIAFQTEEANEFKLNIKIVPVGLDYDNYERFRSRLILNFGKAIPVSDFYDQYKESPVKAINSLKAHLWEKLHPLIVHIESDEFYDLINELRYIYRYRMLEQLPDSGDGKELISDQATVRILSECEKEDRSLLLPLKEKVATYLDKLKSIGISNKYVEKGRSSIVNLVFSLLALIITFPVFLYGFINNYIPFRIAVSIGNNVEDPQFISSFKFGLSRILSPLFHIIQSVIVGLLVSWPIAGIYFVSLLPAALAAYYWYEKLQEIKGCLKLCRLNRSEKSGFTEILDLHREIIRDTDEIVKRFK